MHDQPPAPCCRRHVILERRSGGFRGQVLVGDVGSFHRHHRGNALRLHGSHEWVVRLCYREGGVRIERHLRRHGDGCCNHVSSCRGRAGVGVHGTRHRHHDHDRNTASHRTHLAARLKARAHCFRERWNRHWGCHWQVRVLAGQNGRLAWCRQWHCAAEIGCEVERPCWSWAVADYDAVATYQLPPLQPVTSQVRRRF